MHEVHSVICKLKSIFPLPHLMEVRESLKFLSSSQSALLYTIEQACPAWLERWRRAYSIHQPMLLGRWIWHYVERQLQHTRHQSNKLDDQEVINQNWRWWSGQVSWRSRTTWHYGPTFPCAQRLVRMAESAWCSIATISSCKKGARFGIIAGRAAITDGIWRDWHVNTRSSCTICRVTICRCLEVWQTHTHCNFHFIVEGTVAGEEEEN